MLMSHTSDCTTDSSSPSFGWTTVTKMMRLPSGDHDGLITAALPAETISVGWTASPLR